MTQDLWSYDVTTRRLIDENGLKVAADVVPEDAILILSMRAALAKIETYKDEDFGASAPDQAMREIARQGVAGNLAGDLVQPPGRGAPRPLWLILEEMLTWEADQFDGPPDVSLDVSGADLVDAFANWRVQLRAALTRSPAFHAFDKGYEAGFADGEEEGHQDSVAYWVIDAAQDVLNLARIKYGNLHKDATDAMDRLDRALMTARQRPPALEDQDAPAYHAPVAVLVASAHAAVKEIAAGREAMSPGSEPYAWEAQLEAAADRITDYGEATPAIIRRQVVEALNIGLSYMRDAAEDQATGEDEGIYEGGDGRAEEIEAAIVQVQSVADCVSRNGHGVEIGITLEGGLISDVVCTVPLDGVSIVTLDYDTDGVDRDKLMMVPATAEGGFQPVYRTEIAPTVGPLPVAEDATAPVFDAYFEDE